MNIWEDLKNFKYDDEELEPIFRTNWEGKHHSEMSKKAIGDANRGRVHTAQSRKNMSEAHLGIKYPNRKSPTPWTEEMRKARSELVKKQWARRKANGN